MFARTVFVALALCFAALAEGCVPFATPDIVIGFSPDSRYVAFGWVEGVYPANALLMPVGTGERRLYWCRADNPQKRRSIRVGTAGFPTLAGGEQPRDLCFSPDSRHLAVLTSKMILVVELESGNVRRLNAAWEDVPTFAWITPQTVEYTTLEIDKSPASRQYTLITWRQKITDPLKGRQLVDQQHSAQPLPQDRAWYPCSHRAGSFTRISAPSIVDEGFNAKAPSRDLSYSVSSPGGKKTATITGRKKPTIVPLLDGPALLPPSPDTPSPQR